MFNIFLEKTQPRGATKISWIEYWPKIIPPHSYGGFPIFKIAKWGGVRKNKIVGGLQSGGGKKLWGGAKKFLVVFAKMHNFRKKRENK